MLEAEAQRGRVPPAEIVQELAKQAKSGVGGSGIWHFLSVQAFTGVNERWATADQVEAFARRATETALNDPLGWLDLQNACVMTGDFDAAESALNEAENRGADPRVLTERHGVIEFNRALQGTPSTRPNLDGVRKALSLYKKAHHRRKNNFMGRMGHCEIILAHEGQGQQHLRRGKRYLRRALRLDPFLYRELVLLQDAVGIEHPLRLGASEGWSGLAWRALNRPDAMGSVTRPVARASLRLQLWLRPEHPWVRGWIGRGQLLAGRFDEADKWLEFANEIHETNRVQPMLNAALTCALTGVEESARGYYGYLFLHLTWLLKEHCGVEPHDLVQLAQQPATVRPSLVQMEGYDHARTLARRVLNLSLPD